MFSSLKTVFSDENISSLKPFQLIKSYLVTKIFVTKTFFWIHIVTKIFVTKTIFRKIHTHIATKIFVTKTISYKIPLHLVTKYFVTKKNFCCYICDEKFVTKTNFCFYYFHGIDINL